MSYFFKIVGVKGQQITCELSSIKCYSQNKYTWKNHVRDHVQCVDEDPMSQFILHTGIFM